MYKMGTEAAYRKTSGVSVGSLLYNVTHPVNGTTIQYSGRRIERWHNDIYFVEIQAPRVYVRLAKREVGLHNKLTQE